MGKDCWKEPKYSMYLISLSSSEFLSPLLRRQRLDSFIELVSSSIEYAESTSYQLKPAKGMPLNVKLLKSLRDLSENIRETQAWKASGLRP